MKKRTHRNTTRLTALERAIEVAAPWERLYPANGHVLRNAIERALQAHARQALARERLRKEGGR